MHEILQTLRSLWRDKAFTAVSIAMLALGIASTTAIFSVINTVVLRSSYPEPDRLFAIDEVVPDFAAQYPADAFPVNGRHFDEWRKACTVCESFGLLLGRGAGGNLTGEGAPERVTLLSVSHDLLPTLGVQPILGRGFLPSDDEPGGPRVLLLADSFWRSRFQADPAVVGRDILLNGEPRIVIGVLPPSFEVAGGDYLSEFQALHQSYDALAPARIRYSAIRGAGNFNFGAVVRLKAGATPEQAADQMNAAILPFVEQFNTEMYARLRPFDEAVLGNGANALWMLLAGVVGVLLIVCVNVGNLMLVRSERRVREAAVRRSLGATTGRLLRQALREGLVLSLLGGAAGVLGSYWMVEALIAHAPAETPRLNQVRIDGEVLLFSLAITVAAGLLASVLPAFRFSQGALAGGLRESQASATGSTRRVRARVALVVAEVALSATLLIVAGLVGASFFRLLSVDRGFVTENVLSFDLVLPRGDYPYPDGGRRFQAALLERLEALPGVRSAGLTTKIPLEGSTWVDGMVREGSVQRLEDRMQAEFRFVSSGYWQAMGIPLTSGRLLTQQDRDRKVAVISETAARVVWPGESALGRRFHGGPGSKEPWEVAGVVANVRTAGLETEAIPIVYLSYWLNPVDAVSYAVRTTGDPTALASAIREAVWAVDPAMPITNVRTLTEVVEKAVAPQRFQSMLAGFFGAASLLLAALGIYSVVSYVVGQRTNEIGLRLALGAESSTVLSMVLRQGMGPVLVGLLAGLGCAAALGQWIQSLLFEVRAFDGAVYAGVASVLLAVALFACYVPALRAARVDPMRALRHE